MGRHILQVLIEDQVGNAVPPTIEYEKPHTQYFVEIDKNHTATLTFDNEALQVLKDFKDVPLAELSKEDQIAFFKANFLNQDFDFGTAIDAMKKGFKVARKGWNGKGIFIELQTPDEFSKMTHPYIYIDTTGLQTNNPDAPKNLVPWLASQADMLSEDWILVD